MTPIRNVAVRCRPNEDHCCECAKFCDCNYCCKEKTASCLATTVIEIHQYVLYFWGASVVIVSRLVFCFVCLHLKEDSEDKQRLWYLIAFLVIAFEFQHGLRLTPKRPLIRVTLLGFSHSDLWRSSSCSIRSTESMSRLITRLIIEVWKDTFGCSNLMDFRGYCLQCVCFRTLLGTSWCWCMMRISEMKLNKQSRCVDGAVLYHFTACVAVRTTGTAWIRILSSVPLVDTNQPQKCSLVLLYDHIINNFSTQHSLCARSLTY